MTIKSDKNELREGGQFGPERGGLFKKKSGGQFGPKRGGQLRPKTGGQFDRNFQKDTAEPEKGRTEFSIFNNDTDYLNPSTSPFMINFRVENLVELLKVLKEEGVTQEGNMDEYSYGKFAWIMDPDGNKIELWEPIDDGFIEEK